jgi:hypothetical protein
MNKDPNVKKQIEEMARSFCGFSKTLKCSECSYECYQKEYARKAIEAGYRKSSDVAREIFAEIEDGVKAAVSALQFENNPIHRQVKHETYSSLMCFIKSIEGKCLGEVTE